jgi:hypothetical protein
VAYVDTDDDHARDRQHTPESEGAPRGIELIVSQILSSTSRRMNSSQRPVPATHYY